MHYSQFVKRFGGSVRTKNFQTQRQMAQKPGVNRRVFTIPSQSELPKEFIRLDPWEAEYLYIVAGFATKGIVEVGRFNGGSAFLMACANPRVAITSVDIAPQDDDLLCDLFRKTGVGSNVNLIVGDSQQTKYPDIPAYDVLFVDGDHSYDGAMADLRNWWPQLEAGGHLVCHDSYAAQPCMKAILDFVFEVDAYVVTSPVKHHYHGYHAEGSMAHFMKRA
ncbi:MAG: class I SAM-dependent methyltransferase [Pseudomonadota bacterium]